MIAFTKDENYLLFPVTMENGDSLNYKQYQYGKGLQKKVGTIDFPTLARSGLHDETELDQAKTITGKSISEITKDGHPMQYSREGFMSQDEDIISVLKYDNLLAKKLELTHRQLAKPLFHVWNIVLQGIKRDVWLFEQMDINYILYNGRKVFVNWQGGRGWQESIFNDEILGQYHLEMWREPDQEEKEFLLKNYADLPEKEMADLIKKLSYIHCGEMVPYYVSRYGFYEGHTNFRADPVAIAYIFGLRSIEEIEMVFKGDLFTTLTMHHSANKK
ncbi:MAG: hypothetical protein JEY97_02185 [Bacteroidales bacterium]|nr:hypothetical protein [Bacteroidales bacterium]